MTNIPIDVAKAAIRRAAFIARKAAKEALPTAPQDAAAVFLAQVTVGAGEVVAGYRPICTELDPTPLMTALHARGAALCAPVIEAPGRPLTFRTWAPGAPMTSGPFGAEIPVDGDWVEPTLLITPLVAFDARLQRVGYGGGFYDRTLERLRAQRPTRAYGYAYSAQQIDAAPVGPTDQPLDGVITEAGAL